MQICPVSGDLDVSSVGSVYDFDGVRVAGGDVVGTDPHRRSVLVV